MAATGSPVTNTKSFLAEPGKPTIVMTRVFLAPRRLLFLATTRPEHLARWWGPRRLSLSTCEVDLRPGGAYRYVLRASDGQEFPFRGVYREIVAPERLVFTQRFDVEPYASHESTVTITYEEHAGKTTLTLVQVFSSVEDRDGSLKAGQKEGSLESWDRLAELVATLAKRPELVVSRVFDAPRRLVFEAWSKPEHLAKWLPPRGFTMKKCEMAFRRGGAFQNAFSGPDGTEYPFEGVYTEIVEPSRIAWVGTVHGGLDVETTATFEEHEGKTKLTVHQVYSHESDATRGAPIGWGQSLDKLTELLATLSRS